MKCAIRNHAGFSIVELLVALAISLVVMTGIYQVFLGNSETYRITENYTRLQENGRFALGFLTSEVHSAGYYGCYSDSASLKSTLNDSDDFLYNFDQPIEGFESTSASAWTPAVAASITSPLGGSDILTLRRIVPNAAMRVTANMTASYNSISLSDTVAVGDYLLINDCQESWVFQSTSAGATVEHTVLDSSDEDFVSPGNSQANFTYAFGEGSDVYKIETVSYYVRKNSESPPQPALYRKIGVSDAEEILSEVENMQILYGEDTSSDGNVDGYVTADHVGDWSRVLSVRIGLLVRSATEVAKGELDTDTYTINGQIVDPVDDRRFRRVFTATIGLRNKLL